MKFMPESRQKQLVDAADKTIDYMQDGMQPDEALYKVAAEAGLNSNEVTLVSHAVNNAQTLSALQTEKPENRGRATPLTNAEVVVGKLYPKADTDHAWKDADKQPDATDVKDRLDKTAAANSRVDAGFYFEDTTDHSAILKQAWAIEVPELRKEAAEHPVLGVNRRYSAMIDEARCEAARHQDIAMEKIAALGDLFRKTVAPRFAVVEKLAGVDPALFDLVYDASHLSRVGQARLGNQKIASAATQLELDACGIFKEAAAALETSAEYAAACNFLKAEFAIKEAEALKTAAADFLNSEIKADFSGTHAHTEGAMKDVLGDHKPENLLGAAMDISKSDAATGGPSSPQNPLPLHVRQTLKNVDTSAMIEDLMRDPYIGGHDVPAVVDAYNRAVSTNPKFGKAELTSFIRQDLATEGGIPLDTLLRATKAHQPDKGDDQ